MKTRWGSRPGVHHPQPEADAGAKPYIDYAIAHELCHLVEHNHGPRCYALLDRVMPDWRERRRGLNGCVVG